MRVNQPTTLDDFRGLAKNDANIAVLVNMIERLQGQLRACLRTIGTTSKNSENLSCRQKISGKMESNNHVA